MYVGTNVDSPAHSFWGDINFVSTTTGQPFHVRATADYKTSNVIYLIECRRCKKQYEGETQNLLHIRLNVHCSDIKSKRTEKPVHVAAHFNTMRDLTILLIEKMRNCDPSLGMKREATGSTT